MLSTYTNPLTAPQIASIRSAAETAFPREACGFVLNTGEVIECENISTDDQSFVISASDSALHFDDSMAVWHSHANYSGFTPADIAACKALAIPYAVWNCAGSQCHWLNPLQGAGLLQRPWNYGIHDCYAAVRDWYSQERGVAMGDYPRNEENEWCGEYFTYFEDNFEQEGFARLPHDAEVLRGDVLLFRIRNQHSSNHVAVVEDPAANRIYQHLAGRLSELSSYGGYFRENTYMRLRRPE